MSTVLQASRWIDARGGLGDLAVRIRSGPRTVAYLGASVTLQREGYRPRLHDRVRRRTGHEHRSITLAAGCVGSVSAVFLMDELLVRHRPDLCVVELTTADWSGVTPLEDLPSVLDGIVTKLRHVGCEICFAHLYRADQSFSTEDPVLAAYEAAAERHSVPSLHIGRKLAEHARAGALESGSLLRDVVHTTPRGAELTAGLLDAGLAALEELSTPRPPAPAGPDGPFATARIVQAQPDWCEQPAGASEGRFRLVQSFLRVAAGNRIRCSFDGELVGLVVLAGPTSGVVRLETAASTEDVPVFDGTCFYERLTTVLLERRVPRKTPIVIVQTDQPIAHSTLRRPMPAEFEGAQRELRLVGCMVR